MPYYFIILNIISFCMYGLDKLFAIRRKRRINKRSLLIFTMIGGCIGSSLAMILFHHKIRKPEFVIINILTLLTYTCIIVNQCKLDILLLFCNKIFT